ncbi:response regulator [Ideonella azotifigens]|uniref:Response regulator n=2 Tax=Ideonella TaxID=36862 RepID=A0ABP3V8Z8_9BURK|nr:response regulator [Ideonella azotifigens]
MSGNRPILLVEDNPMDVDLTRRAFAKRHIANPLAVARDGEEALDWLPRWEAGEPLPVVILLDLKLPRVSGLEVLRQFKAHPLCSRIPVVVLTTSREDADVATAYGLGVNSYIVKPVEFEKFIEVAAQIDLYWCVLNQNVPSH